MYWGEKYIIIIIKYEVEYFHWNVVDCMNKVSENENTLLLIVIPNTII